MAAGRTTGMAVRAIVGLALASVALGSTACASGSVSKDEVAKKVSAEVAKSGRAPDSVTCSDNLAATVGATSRCSVQTGGRTVMVVAKVAKVEGGKPQIEMQIEGAPR